MKTLNEVKKELKSAMKLTKEYIKKYKNESKSISKAGYMIESSGYERRMVHEANLENLKYFYDMIKNVKKIK